MGTSWEPPLSHRSVADCTVRPAARGSRTAATVGIQDEYNFLFLYRCTRRVVSEHEHPRPDAMIGRTFCILTHGVASGGVDTGARRCLPALSPLGGVGPARGACQSQRPLNRQAAIAAGRRRWCPPPLRRKHGAPRRVFPALTSPLFPPPSFRRPPLLPPLTRTRRRRHGGDGPTQCVSSVPGLCTHVSPYQQGRRHGQGRGRGRGTVRGRGQEQPGRS